jgi:hypothetical protein
LAVNDSRVGPDAHTLPHAEQARVAQRFERVVA